jgi:hypothetical protein
MFWLAQCLANNVLLEPTFGQNSFGQQYIWPTQSLADPMFGRPSIWLTQYLADPVFGWSNVLPTL